jgi:signal transduction histidine kinase
MSGLRDAVRRHGSVRLRLALMSAALFLVLGTILIVAIAAIGRAGATVQVTSVIGQRVAPATPQILARVVNEPATNLLIAQHNADDAHLLAISWVLLLLTAIASIPLGWFASGWMLRPLRRITERTRTISAGTLHERLALVGPRDEFTELGDTLDELFGRLETSFDAQRRFVANASHELRTPLTLERTLLQVALADPDASAITLRAVCEELLASGREHERLLEAMLTLASSERRLEHPVPADLGALAAAVLSTPRPEIDAEQLTLITDLQRSETIGEPALIERLISNLVDNAVRHNVPGGHVEIRTAASDGNAVITVENSGRLIAPDQIERMFEPFRRLGLDRTGPGSSQHGLGLSIVRAIANTHGATISARPRVEGGLTITVAFPAAPPDQPAGPVAQSTPGPTA